MVLVLKYMRVFNVVDITTSLFLFLFFFGQLYPLPLYDSCVAL